MKCPVDGTALTMTERSGVEIDYCPQCRGVWLDRGELDKIIDRVAPPAVLPEPRRDEGRREAAPQDLRGRLDPRDDDRRRDEGRREGRGERWRDDDDDGYRKKKRGGLLGDIFDF